MSRRSVIGGLVLGLLLGAASPSSATASAAPYRQVEVRVHDGNVVLPATLVVPSTAGRHRGVAFVHGSGPGPRGEYLPLAQAFASAGIVGLVYDKRSQGYMPGLGGSFSDLANDALAAVRLLRSRPEVDPARVGLWALSEGGWVAPIAATRSSIVSFLILVGAPGIPRTLQAAWSLGNDLRRTGARGGILDAMVVKAGRLVEGTGLFPEGDYDPASTLARLHQPVLAIWSATDPVVPPVESSRVLCGALERGGDHDYTIRFFGGASHSLRVSPDGFYYPGRPFAPGYFDLMTAWVNGLPASAAPAPGSRVGGPAPQQRQPLPAAVVQAAWYQSSWLQLGIAGFLLIAFVLPLARGGTPAARWLGGLGLAALVGLFSLLALGLSDAPVVGPIGPAGRPLAWLALQVLAFGAVAAAAVFVAGLARRPRTAGRDELVLAAAGLLFVPWAWYWDLLLPG